MEIDLFLVGDYNFIKKFVSKVALQNIENSISGTPKMILEIIVAVNLTN